MGTRTWKLETCYPNPKNETRLISEFPSKFPIFYSRNSKKAPIFSSKITLELFWFRNYFFFQKYFNLYEVWKILVHKNAIKIAEGSKISYFKTRKTRLKLPKPDPIPRINTRTRLFSSKNAFKFVIFLGTENPICFCRISYCQYFFSITYALIQMRMK